MSHSPKSDSEDWAEWEVLNVQNGGKSQKSPQITSVSEKIDMNKDSSNSSAESFSQVQIDSNSSIENKNVNVNANPKRNPIPNNNNNSNNNNNLYSSHHTLMTSQLVTNHDDEKQSVLWTDTNKLPSRSLFNNNNNNNFNSKLSSPLYYNSLPQPQPQPQPPQQQQVLLNTLPRQQQYYHPNNNNQYMNNMNMNMNMNMNNPYINNPNVPLLPQVQVQSQPQPVQVPSSYWNSFNIFNQHSQPQQVQQAQVQPQIQPLTTQPLLFNPLIQVSQPPLPAMNNVQMISNKGKEKEKEKEKEELEQDIDNKWKCVKCNTNYDESYRFCPTCGASTSLLDGIENNNHNKNNDNILTFKQIIAEGNYDPNEKRQSGWLLNNTSNNRIKGSYKLIHIEGSEEMKVEYDSYFDINLTPNEDLYLLCDVTAPSISGKYSCLYQIVSNDKYEHSIGPLLELNITVNKLFDEKKESKIEQIIKMGFNNRNQVVQCLQKHKWNVNEAIEDLCPQ